MTVGLAGNDACTYEGKRTEFIDFRTGGRHGLSGGCRHINELRGDKRVLTHHATSKSIGSGAHKIFGGVANGGGGAGGGGAAGGRCKDRRHARGRAGGWRQRHHAPLGDMHATHHLRLLARAQMQFGIFCVLLWR